MTNIDLYTARLAAVRNISLAAARKIVAAQKASELRRNAGRGR